MQKEQNNNSNKLKNTITAKTEGIRVCRHKVWLQTIAPYKNMQPQADSPQVNSYVFCWRQSIKTCQLTPVHL